MAIIQHKNGEAVIGFGASELRSMRRRRKPPTEREHFEQVALFEWAQYNISRLPELDLLFAIPNGGKRSKAVAGKLKAEGVKAGVPDICLPVARRGYHGLFIELKAEGGQVTELQELFIERVSEQDYFAKVCVGAQNAIATLT